MKKIIRRAGLGLLLALVIAGWFGRESILKTGLKQALRIGFGFRTEIKQSKTNGKGPIELRGVTVFNPPEFGDTTFLKIPVAQFQLDWSKAAEGKCRLEWLRLRVAELQIVEPASGPPNLNRFMGDAKKATGGHVRGGRWKFDGIGRLELTLDQIRWTTLKPPATSEVRLLRFKTETRTNLVSAEDFNALLLTLLLRNGVVLPGNYLSEPGAMGRPIPGRFDK